MGGAGWRTGGRDVWLKAEFECSRKGSFSGGRVVVGVC